MDHIAIMKKSWRLIPKIVSGAKTIESRWYKARFAPWDRIRKGDTVYFKNSGEPVIASAKVERVLQFGNLNKSKITNIIKRYGKQIGLTTPNYTSFYHGKKYCILIFLENPKQVTKPFHVNKKGFGNACAWMCVDSINSVKM